jgi:CubicO group peptidase (beta-lactamase class C family)
MDNGDVSLSITRAAEVPRYEALVRARILDPLGLSNTRITLTPEMKARIAVGHKETPRTSDNPYGLTPVPYCRMS